MNGLGDQSNNRGLSERIFASYREWIALKIAPWLFVPYREEREEAFKMLAEVAYGSRDAIWTSPTVLAKCALEYAAGKRPRLARRFP